MDNGTRRALQGRRLTVNGTYMVDIETGIAVLGRTTFEHGSLVDIESASVAQSEESYRFLWRPFPALVELVQVVPGKRPADA